MLDVLRLNVSVYRQKEKPVQAIVQALNRIIFDWLLSMPMSVYVMLCGKYLKRIKKEGKTTLPLFS